MTDPLITITVPSLNQGRYLGDALSSIFAHDLPVEVFVMDAGSTDGSVDVIRQWETKLAGWRSGPDAGQAAAINEGVARGTAPYVAWLNSDDHYEPGGLTHLLNALQNAPTAPAAFGKAWDLDDASGTRKPAWVEPFDEKRLALRCIVSQPATLIRRTAWEAVGGLDPNLHMAMDYDLWWKLYRWSGEALAFADQFVATNRIHDATKTNRHRSLHYREAIEVVRRHYGRVPIKWYVGQPYKVWWKTALHRLRISPGARSPDPK